MRPSVSGLFSPADGRSDVTRRGGPWLLPAVSDLSEIIANDKGTCESERPYNLRLAEIFS
jgi:hypothetical protein